MLFNIISNSIAFDIVYVIKLCKILQRGRPLFKSLVVSDELPRYNSILFAKNKRIFSNFVFESVHLGDIFSKPRSVT